MDRARSIENDPADIADTHLNDMEVIMAQLSPLRGVLAGFDHSYRLAICRRETTGRHQFVLRTRDPIQPFRVTEARPAKTDDLVLHVA